jgi:hypothetical protein
LLAAVLALSGCEHCAREPAHVQEPWEEPELAPEVFEAGEPDPDAPEPPAISDQVVSNGDVVREPPRVLAAASPDAEHANDEPVPARRYVYRVSMIVPAGLGEGGDHIALPSAELFIDASSDRLRARFTGQGWPVPAGSEVRLRRDRPGVYLFDDEGGRPLEPGLMADWFEGGRVTRRGPPMRVTRPYRPPRRASREEAGEDEPLGDLVCALLAEWSAESRESVARRCERGAPFAFRVGFWRAEQTAAVRVELPRSSLRADEEGAPELVPAQSSRAFLEPSALARITPSGPREESEIALGSPADGIEVANESPTRVLVTVQGMAIGWVDAAARANFVGLRPGSYEVGSIRPLGGVVARSRTLDVPGLLRLCEARCPRAPAPEAPE